MQWFIAVVLWNEEQIRGLFGAIRNRATRPHTTKRANLLRNLEAPPGFEPGMEVCRGQILYLADSSCFLVGPTPPFFPVFGRNCSQIVPSLGTLKRPDARSSLRSAHDQVAGGIAAAHQAFA